MAETLELPEGFADAPEAVQEELLATYESDELVTAIQNKLNLPSDYGLPQLDKREKVAILLALRSD